MNTENFSSNKLFHRSSNVRVKMNPVMDASQPLKTLLWLSLIIGFLANPILAQNWTATDPLNEDRRFHGAALLPSGKVLVPGGQSFGVLRNTAEIYDPDAVEGSKWTFAAPMPRGHRRQAILLTKSSPNIGKVLFVGEDLPPKSAYLFDETAGPLGTWASTANKPRLRRYASSLIELANGNVLYPAGYCGGLCATYKTAEIYNPITNKWSMTGTLTTKRADFTATLLTVGPNAGKVLVTGGFIRTGFIIHNSTEIYDPSTEKWSAAAPMNSSRAQHTATVLPDGKILVTGGEDATLSPVSTAEIYDPMLNTWTSIGSMSTARLLHTATLLADGRVLVAGGTTLPGVSGVTPTSEIYDPITKSWTVVGSMITPRTMHKATLLSSGLVLVSGGAGDGNIPLESAELFDPTLQLACSDYPCGKYDRKILMCHIPPDNPSNSHEICISPNAVDAHIAHGDICGPCADSISSNPQVALRGKFLNSTRFDEGELFDRSFQIACSDYPCGKNDRKILMCHIPPDDTSNRHEICISPNAVDAHLAHGDICGPCVDSITNNLQVHYRGKLLTATEYDEQEIGKGELLENHGKLIGLKLESYPNPFKYSTTIQFSLSSAKHVSLNVFNVSGKHVAVLFDGQADKSVAYTVKFDAANLSSGVYYYQLVVDEQTYTKKLVMIK